MNYKDIEEEVRNTLSPKRFTHTMGVVERAEELALAYGLDENKVKLVAVVHDIAKELTYDEAYKYVKENNIILDEIEKEEPVLLHSKIGAHMAKTKFEFTDEMANAILYHTTGNVKMDTLAKIIFIADKTEKRKNPYR